MHAHTHTIRFIYMYVNIYVFGVERDSSFEEQMIDTWPNIEYV